jgi:Undecaprenyl-phosphate glucose phosphotransferase
LQYHGTVGSETVSIETRNRSSFNSPAIQSAAVSNDAVQPVKTARLAFVIGKIMAVEFLAIASSAYIASFIYHAIFLSSPFPEKQYIFAALFIAALFSLVSVGLQHFTAIQMRPLHMLLWSGIGAVGFAFSLFLTAIFLLKLAEDYSRGAFIFQLFCVCVAVIGVRAISFSWIRSGIASGLIAARHVVLIGDTTRCAEFSDRLRTSAIQSVASFRFPWDRDVTTEGDDTDAADRKVRKLISACRAIGPDDIILLASQKELPKTMGFASSLSELPVGVHIIPADVPEFLAATHIAEFGSLLTIQVNNPPLSQFDLVIKRSFDVFAATVGLLVLSPLFLIVSLAIKLDSPGPVFFRQLRHGFNNEPIRVLKFRSMTTLENGAQCTQAVRNDPRVTRVGRLLRQTNIDELPQLINVLQGNMSIVGPRPHATAHNKFFRTKIAPFSRRHTVKPGITGWAQVKGFRGETDTLEKMQRRVELDLYYIDNWSFLLDIKIILLTLLSKRIYTNAY